MTINHYNDALAKELLKYRDTYKVLAAFVITLCLPGTKVCESNLIDKEFKNSENAEKSIMDLLAEVKTTAGIFRIDFEIQAYRSSFLERRMGKYEAAMFADEYINLKEKLPLPKNIQLWLFKHGEKDRFEGRLYIIVRHMDDVTYRKYNTGSLLVLVNGEYFSGDKKPESEAEAIVFFFSLTDPDEIERFVRENNFESLYNMLERQKKFFGEGSLEMDAYEKREIELQELKDMEEQLQAKDEAIKALTAKADAEAKARAEAEARIAELEAKLAAKS